MIDTTMIRQWIQALARRLASLSVQLADQPLESLRPTAPPGQIKSRGGCRPIHGPSSASTLRANELTNARLREAGQPIPTADRLGVPATPT